MSAVTAGTSARTGIHRIAGLNKYFQVAQITWKLMIAYQADT